MDKDQFWGNCLNYIRDRIPEQAYQTWFAGVTISTINQEEIILQVPNQFHYEWLESKYRHLIDAAVKEFAKHPLIINYSVVVSKKSSDDIPSLLPKEKPIPQGYQKRTQLNGKYTFDHFIEGKGNQFAKAAAMSVAENPGQTPYNPLLIYSDTGLGKTHLLQAIGNFSIYQNPTTRVVYFTSEKFMLDFIRAIQSNKSPEFSSAYRNVDVLLLDDVQFFQKRQYRP